MKMGLSNEEGRVLHGLIEEASGDIVVRLDASGFIVFASQNVSDLGHDLSSMLVMPHIADLAESEYKSALGNFVKRALGGENPRGWFEFPIITSGSDHDRGANECRSWYAFSLRLIEDDNGAAQGALGLLRSVQHKRTLEGELHSRAVTNPLTGLANRQAFCASLRRHLSDGGGQLVAVFAVDRMQALSLQYGQRTSDEIMWGFAKFLETMALPGHEIAQIDNERLAVILPDMSPVHVREWSDEVLRTFSSIALPGSSRAPKLTASAGLAQVEYTVDWTLRQAELALLMARAGGGMRVSECVYQGGCVPSYRAGADAASSLDDMRAVGVAGRAR